ncbi:hypothetical protein ACIBI9_28545 [Nonomuraea sp. NPDC050451]|uniref:hypothetical protein n=1 Tax=Nonomuraea sp. NPDC050451 TaxID=3364364 RepID=UPI0037BB3587
MFNVVAPVREWLPHLMRAERVPEWPAPLSGRQVAVTMMSEGRGFSDAGAKLELGRKPRYSEEELV